MRATDVIVRKRDGEALSPDEIRFMVDGVTRGSVPDYQASAWLMAVLLRGMSPAETTWLTEAMVQSGTRLDLSGIPGLKVDKHSTGGVGDKTSLIIAPLVAACGVPVPMMSGRGLGHTGGTLDKLESIPGFRVHLSVEEMWRALERTGCVMMGQTAAIAPADRKLYALRDVTGTVESIPLISASIMSKKIAEGIDALVLDVKTGSGAFMKTEEQSRRLAESLVSIGRASGLRTEALVTGMDTPLGLAVGNALEVAECLDVLKGEGPEDLLEVSVALASRMLVLGEAAADLATAERRVRTLLASGAGLERFRRIIEMQGGDPAIVDDPRRLPAAPYRHVVTTAQTGFVTRVDAELIGRAAVVLGAGRDRIDDPIDPSVGIVLKAKPRQVVTAGQALLELHYADPARLQAALPLVERALVVSEIQPPAVPLIRAEVHA